jgi:thiol-disulfide isomerase/thioredoxin
LLGQVVSLDLPSDTGKLVSIPWRGPRSYVLDFWAPSCKPCKKKLPALVARKQELASKGASLVLVAVLDHDESSNQAREVLASWGVKEPFLVSDTEASKTRAGVATLPATLVLDTHGRLLWSAPDTASDQDVLNAVP